MPARQQARQVTVLALIRIHTFLQHGYPVLTYVFHEHYPAMRCAAA